MTSPNPDPDEMSAESRPIAAEAFAAALTELPLSAVYAKALEIQNSKVHLERSNAELRLFIQETPGGDKDCEEAVVENEDVIKRMVERIALVRAEVEGRGQKWIDLEGTPEEEGKDGEDTSERQEQNGETAAATTSAQNAQQQQDARQGQSNGVSPAEPESNETEEGVYL